MNSFLLSENISKIIDLHFKKYKKIGTFLTYEEYKSTLINFMGFLFDNDLSFLSWETIQKNSSEILLVSNETINNFTTSLVKVKSEKSKVFQNRELIQYINSYEEFIIDKIDFHFYKFFVKFYEKIKNEKLIKNDFKEIRFFTKWMNENIDYEKILILESEYPVSEYLNLIFNILKPIAKGQHVGIKQRETFYKELKEILLFKETYLFKQNDSLERIKKSLKVFGPTLFSDEEKVKKMIVDFSKKYNINLILLMNSLYVVDSIKIFESFPQDLFAKNNKYIYIADIANAIGMDIIEFWFVSKQKFDNFDHFYEFYIKNCRKNNLYILKSFSEFEIFLKHDFHTDLIYKKIYSARKRI
ncbi:hypothetical protein [[Mycoplasma] mobile]|uniref:Uncharacterized protein n=1 Tax=Mycoplasma mobile (strain ATCC 43663 / 163K / NCTC 11711) TaxID=267748 RepID=Q6KHS9_MYCM1|nr:hypothetical protein [[Mycoplasma] mobile]AAT27849.1 hypothetical protein MMOB3630 [Mycoplasma mobile 163K]